MITLVDGAIACVVALCMGVLISELSRGSKGTKPTKPGSEHKSAAQADAGPLWVFVPNRECERVLIAPCISKHARFYVNRFRN